MSMSRVQFVYIALSGNRNYSAKKKGFFQSSYFPTSSNTNMGSRKVKSYGIRLCYHCHEKFARNYRCQSTKLSLMELTIGDQSEDVDEVNAIIAGNPKETDIVEILFHVILGKTNGVTMKLYGEINHRKVLILVDSGSTHNFMA